MMHLLINNVASENKKINALDHCSFLENEKNIGRTATRNILAKKAKYDWLLFLDADVIPLNENYIASIYKGARQKARCYKWWNCL